MPFANSKISLDRLPPLSVIRAEIARREAERERGDIARNAEAIRARCKRLVGFTEFTNPRYRTAAHHRLISAQIERAIRGEIDRLMIIVPPRHGKSEIASRRAPAWALGENPALQFISASAGSDLARDFGRDVRNIVNSEAYQAIYPTRLAEDAKAANKWNTSEGGSYYAVGVGSQVMGRGADILLIDDPFGTMEDADNEIARDRVWKWYQGSLYNRLQPGGRIIVIGHRMHEDDLQGRLLAQQSQGGDKWEVVNLPAIAEANDPLGRFPGEPLWESDYPLDALRRIEANTIPRYWSALYCGKGSPAHGDMFRPDKLLKVDAAPECISWVRGWDLGGSKSGDPSVGVKMGRTLTGHYVVADIRRIRGTPEEVEREICGTASLDGPRVRISLPQDPGQAGLFQVKYLTSKLSGFSVSSSLETGSKEIRAEPFAAQLNVGNVSMVRGDWNYAYVDEIRGFPVGAHDDQVDASSRAFMQLSGIASPMVFSPDFLRRAAQPVRRAT